MKDTNLLIEFVSHTDFTTDLQPHYDDALRYCKALCAHKSSIESDEILQLSLVKALTGYPLLKDRSRFRPWLFRIITRTFYSTLRGAFWKRFTSLQQAAEIEPIPAVFTEEEAGETSRMLYQALATLSPKQRAALLLFELGGFTVEEIARIQGATSISAVKSRLSRARKKLRHMLTEAESGRQSLSSPRLSSHEDLEHETITLVAQAHKNLRQG